MATRTLRRRYVDTVLNQTPFVGDILDVGGQKDKKRGEFRPPETNSWKFLNTDESTNPDFLCSAEQIPCADSSFDMVLLAEVLEHLSEPEIVLEEIARVVKPGGQLVITVPFLYGVHADPDDYQRWTPSALQFRLKKVGFEVVELQAMGGLVSVIHDLVYQSVSGGSAQPTSLFSKLVRKAFLPVLSFFETKKLYSGKDAKITTGFYVLAEKK